MASKSIRLMLALLALFQLASAVDIIGYSNTGACQGSGYSFNGIGASICCDFGTTGSILFTGGAGSCQLCAVYRGGGCSNQVSSGTGPICFVGGGFSGAAYNNRCRRRSLFADTSDAFQGQFPTGVVYTEDATKGHWVLKTASAKGILSEMETLPESEKCAWLKARGASFVTSESAEIVIKKM